MNPGTFILKINRKQSHDSGLALTLILLILGYLLKNHTFYLLAIPVIFLVMTIPMIFYPFALIWINLSNLLGFLMSKIILFAVFSIFVIPVGLIRKLAAKDDLQIKDWKKSSNSVFIHRDHLYISEDLKHPY